MYGNFAGWDALGAWPGSLLIKVCYTMESPTRCIASHRLRHSEMLTPIDQRLDKLEDFHPDEVYMYTCSDACSSAKT